MDRAEAAKILDHQISELKILPYAKFLEWQQRKHIEVFDIKSANNKYYKIEVQAVLEDSNSPSGNIRVIATIDDSHLVSLNTNFQLYGNFIIAPNNSIVSE